jgi:hypothetical protein
VSDPHQPGTPAGTDPGDLERRAALAEVLGKKVWPADRDTLVAKAADVDAPDGVLGRLRGLPADRQFANVQEVAQALGLGIEQERF